MAKNTSFTKQESPNTTLEQQVEKQESPNTTLEQQVEKQANTIARLENEMKNITDPNKEPRIIQKGKQKHPKFIKNKIKTPATIPKE